jgi:hypothetical protein
VVRAVTTTVDGGLVDPEGSRVSEGAPGRREITMKLHVQAPVPEEEGDRRNWRRTAAADGGARRAPARFSEPRADSLEVDGEGDEARRTAASERVGVAGVDDMDKKCVAATMGFLPSLSGL